MVKIPELKATQILEAVSGTVIRGKAEVVAVSSIAEPSEAQTDSVVFLIAPQYIAQLPKCKARVLIIDRSLEKQVQDKIPEHISLVILAPDAYLGLARVTELVALADPAKDWDVTSVPQGSNVHPTAKIHPTAVVASSAVICAHTDIGPRSVVLPKVVIGAYVVVGADCVLFPGAVLYPRTILGDRVRVHANAVLGADGFGYARGAKGSVKIWHLGRVIVGSDIEIGANTCIDRGTLKDSIIEDGVKIDNQVQVGHNGYLKAHAVLCAQTGLAGNVTVGRGAILAGRVGVADKIEIGDGAIIGPNSGVSKDIPAGATMMGTFTCKPRWEWWKSLAFFDRLPEIFDRVKKLENQVKS